MVLIWDMAETKYIFITQSEGASCVKGVMASSIAALMQSCSYSVTVKKLNACLNVDTDGRGERFVTADGCETDMELGRYERFTGVETSGVNLITAGRVYQNVINRERRGDYHGETVRVIPHVTDEIKRCVSAAANSGKSDFVVVELGGVIGDVETLPFVEALRQMKNDSEDGCVWIHMAGECEVQGVQPDIMIVPTELGAADNEKVFQLRNDVATIYEMPLLLHDVAEMVQRKAGMEEIRVPRQEEWKTLVQRINEATETVTIGIVGADGENDEAYCSLKELLLCAAVHQGRKLDLCHIDAAYLHEGNVDEMLGLLDGVVIAPDRGRQGFEGKMVAAKWCRMHDATTLGIAEGMHCMVIEYARNILGLQEANSTEIEARTPHNVIDMMTEQKSRVGMWGVKRMGAGRTNLKGDSVIARAYGAELIQERHCHSFELNNGYCNALEEVGMICVGINPESALVDAVEVKANAWYVGVQFRTEFNGTAFNPNPLLMDFVREIKSKKK